jgi:hypothetical protein
VLRDQRIHVGAILEHRQSDRRRDLAAFDAHADAPGPFVAHRQLIQLLLPAAVERTARDQRPHDDVQPVDDACGAEHVDPHSRCAQRR